MAGSVPVADLPSQARDNPKGEVAKSLDKGGQRVVRYPLNIEELDHWMVFKINSPVFGRKDDFAKKSSKALIYLPMPMNVGAQYSHSYNTQGMGLAGMAGADMGADFSEGGIKSLVDGIASGLSGDKGAEVVSYYAAQVGAEAAAAVGAKLGGFQGGVLGAAAGQAVKGAMAGAGIARNPYMAVMYSQPEFRSYAFSWKLVARSRAETKAIEDIIHLFKFHAAPGQPESNPHFFSYPEQFDIDFNHAKHLFNPAPSVCKSVQVNYHAEGQPLYHEYTATEKSPVSVKLDLSFQEVAIVTKESIKKQNR